MYPPLIQHFLLMRGWKKILAESVNLASDKIGHLSIIDLSSEAGIQSLKMNTTVEEYNQTIPMMNVEETKLGVKANELKDKLEAVENLSSRELRNKLYEEAYNKDYDIIRDYDVRIIENLTRHFFDLIESPKNPLGSVVLAGMATVYTTIVIINQLFLSINDTVELGWIEREYYATNKAKWDGVLFKVCNHKVSAGFVEFSGGANDRISVQKERHDIRNYTR